MAETPDNSNHLPPTEMPDGLAEVLPAYALGIVDDDERAAVDAWLAANPSHHRELAAFQAVVDRLPLVVDEREPAVDLRARVLSTAAGVSAAAPRPPTLMPAPLAWHRRPAPWAAIAAALLVAALGLGVWSAVLRGQLAEQRSVAQQLQDQLVASQAQIALLQTQPRVTIYTISGTSDAPNATGEVVFVPQQQAAFLTITNLPAVAPDRAYQVWFIQDGQPVSAGLLPTAPHQAAARLQADLSRYQALAVSLEPLGGSPRPTGPIMVQAPLTAGNA